MECSRCGAKDVNWDIHTRFHQELDELVDVIRAWSTALAGPQPPEMTQQMSMEDIAAALGATEWPGGGSKK